MLEGRARIFQAREPGEKGPARLAWTPGVPLGMRQQTWAGQILRDSKRGLVRKRPLYQTLREPRWKRNSAKGRKLKRLPAEPSARQKGMPGRARSAEGGCAVSPKGSAT